MVTNLVFSNFDWFIWIVFHVESHIIYGVFILHAIVKENKL